MSDRQSNEPAVTPGGGVFEVTSWTTILQARGDEAEAADALNRLVSKYYRPVERTILLRCRCSAEEAKDLAQEFFKESLRRDFLRDVAPGQGRFRTFIRRCLENFLRDVHDKASAVKRGGGVAPVSLEQTNGEGRPVHDPAAANEDPGVVLDREWAREVIASALRNLQGDCVTPQKSALFVELRDHLRGRADPAPAAEMATRLGLSESALHVARHRLRQKFGEWVVDEVRSTVAEDGDWREELDYLLRLVRF